jgi:phosphoglycolate phosphatase
MVKRFVMSPAPKLAVFDCDGTLVDSQHRIGAAMCAAFAGRGHAKPDPVLVRRVVGLSLVEAVARLLPGHAAEEHAVTANLYKAAFGDLRQRGEHDEPLYPGALEALDAIEGMGFLLGIATGKSLRGLRAVLARHGLEGRFVTLQTADQAPGKPHPAMLQQAIAEAGSSPERAVMIGDTVFDIEMGRNAGVLPLGVAWGYHDPHELSGAGAMAVAASFADLPPLLRSL